MTNITYASRLCEAGFDVTLTRGAHSWFWRLFTGCNLSPGTVMARKPPH
ncbi:hypothetical protein [Dyella monticola]|nr:hypothetical protein [Dyella monticola]